LETEPDQWTGPVHIIVTAFRGRTLEQKRELVRRFTEVAASVLGVDAEAVTIEIDEGGPEDWGRGGLLSIDRTPTP
jgi:4-oxalocrotonate tautomerase family enzyme